MRQCKIEEAIVWCHLLVSAWILTLTFVSIFVISGCDSQKSQLNETRPPVVRVRVYAFTLSWCGPCKCAGPTIASIRAAGADVTIIDIDKSPGLTKKYGIKSVPTFIVYVGNKAPIRTQNVYAVLRITISAIEGKGGGT